MSAENRLEDLILARVDLEELDPEADLDLDLLDETENLADLTDIDLPFEDPDLDRQWL